MTEIGINSSEWVPQLPTKWYLGVMKLNYCESHKLTVTLKVLQFFWRRITKFLLLAKRTTIFNLFTSMKFSSVCESYHGKVPFALAGPVAQNQQYQQTNDPRPIKILRVCT